MRQTEQMSFGKRALRAIAVVFFCCVGIGVCINNQTPSPRAAAAPAQQPAQQAVAPRQPEFTVSIRKLLSAYRKNELAADSKYKGHLFAIEGTVRSIDKDIMGKGSVSFSGFDDQTVTCNLANGAESDAALLAEGKEATLVGTGSNYYMRSTYFMDGCRVTEYEK